MAGQWQYPRDNFVYGWDNFEHAFSDPIYDSTSLDAQNYQINNDFATPSNVFSTVPKTVHQIPEPNRDTATYMDFADSVETPSHDKSVSEDKPSLDSPFRTPQNLRTHEARSREAVGITNNVHDSQDLHLRIVSLEDQVSQLEIKIRELTDTIFARLKDTEEQTKASQSTMMKMADTVASFHEWSNKLFRSEPDH